MFSHQSHGERFAGIDEADFEDLGESSNNSSLLLADDVQLQADETDQSTCTVAVPVVEPINNGD